MWHNHCIILPKGIFPGHIETGIADVSAVMNYSRTNPSSRYLDLQAMYRQMHQHGEQFLGTPAAETFPGFSLDAQMDRIKDLIARTGAQTLLDYGCGKGQQYGPRIIKDAAGNQWPSVIDYWDIDELECYDPCYEKFSRLPEGKFDGVICTDVLEHCPEEDMGWIVDEIFGYARRFVFANVACYPAKKRLPSGENAHCTIKPVEWWEGLVRDIAARHQGVSWEFWVQSEIKSDNGAQLIEQRLGSPA